MKADLSDLEKKLNLNFKDKNLLLEALTHRSYLNENWAEKSNSNERLEFLGDAVLAFWVSSQIFQRFPLLPEGKLTSIKTHLVRTETLTEISENLGLGLYLRMSKGEELGGGRENPVLLANTLEAVLGAIFSDQGIEKASLFLKDHLETKINLISDADSLKDSKSLLQELVQAKGSSSPVYKLVSASGPDHQKVFTMGVYLDDKLLAEGVKKSKQDAEEEAAKKALENFAKIK